MPAITSGISWIAREGAWKFSKHYFIKKMTEILKQHFSEPIMKGLAYFMASVIEDNWDKISQYTSLSAIGRFILNNIFRGSGNLIFGKTQQKTWTKDTPIKFEKNK